MKLRNKVTTLLTLCLFTVGVITSYSVWLLADKIYHYNQLIQIEGNAARLTNHANLNFKRQVQEWKNVLLRGSNPERREKYWNSFLTRHQQVAQAATEFIQLPVSSSLKTKMSDFKAIHRELLEKYKNGYNAFLESNFDHSVADQAVSGIDRAPTKQLEDLSNNVQDLIVTKSRKNSADAKAAINFAIVAIILVIAISLVLANWYMQTNVIQPLINLINHLRKVSKGDLNQQEVYQRRDEIGNMSRAVEAMRTSLQNFCSSIEHSQNELTTVCNNLLTSSKAISEGVTEQNQDLNNVQSAIQELVTMADQITSHSHSAAKAAQQANQSADTSIKAMKDTVHSIDDSSQQIQDTAKVIASLDEDARQIGSVLDVIKGIAEQTNLLALNAAIEAARAGEQGRGFAVVADEVRTLAARTQQSTEEIQNMIANVQTGTQNAVNAIEQGQKISDLSVHKVAEADSNLNTITNAIEDINRFTADIISSIVQQTSVTQTIMHSVDKMEKVARVNDQHAQSYNNDNTLLQDVKDRMTTLIASLRK